MRNPTWYFYTLKPDDIAVGLAGNSDEVIYPTLIPAKISGVSFVVQAYPWGREKKAQANQPWNFFQGIPTCDHDTSPSQTDRRTDGRTNCRSNTALCL